MQLRERRQSEKPYAAWVHVGILEEVNPRDSNEMGGSGGQKGRRDKWAELEELQRLQW